MEKLSSGTIRIMNDAGLSEFFIHTGWTVASY